MKKKPGIFSLKRWDNRLYFMLLGSVLIASAWPLVPFWFKFMLALPFIGLVSFVTSIGWAAIFLPLFLIEID